MTTQTETKSQTKRRITRQLTTLKNKGAELYHSKKLDFLFRESGRLDEGVAVILVWAIAFPLILFANLPLDVVFMIYVACSMVIVFTPFRRFINKPPTQEKEEEKNKK